MKKISLVLLLLIQSQMGQAQVVSAFTEKCMNQIYNANLISITDKITLTTLKDIDLSTKQDYKLDNEKYIKHMKDIGQTNSDGSLRTYIALQYQFSYSNFWTNGFNHTNTYGFIPKNTQITYYIKDIGTYKFQTIVALAPENGLAQSVIQNATFWTEDGLGYKNTNECSYGNRPFIDPKLLVQSLNKRFKSSLIVNSVQINKKSW